MLTEVYLFEMIGHREGGLLLFVASVQKAAVLAGRAHVDARALVTPRAGCTCNTLHTHTHTHTHTHLSLIHI